MMTGRHLMRAPALFVYGLTASCSPADQEGSEMPPNRSMNPVSYFEIPVEDMGRATTFYEGVFSVTLDHMIIDGNEMALFPTSEDATGVSGALAKGESYVPSRGGPRIYFSVISIDRTLNQVEQAGGRIAYPKTSIGDLGWVGEFLDSEGNQIALHSSEQ